MQGLSTEIIQQESQLQIEEERSNSLEKKIDMLRNRYNRYLEKGRLFDQSQDESIRIAQYAVMTVEVMDAFKKRIQVKRVMGLENKIHECFSFMIQKESIIRRIDIDPDTLDIRLIDYTGGELLKTQLSAGEKQLLAVSILWGLAQSSGYDMPVIVDTPLGRLDSQHRTNFVERYLPHASKQVIVLSTDEEINGRYFTLIRPYVNAVYTLVYDDESKSTSISGGYFGGKSI
jgi:DNA sulfur modification protein DndD